MRDDIENALEQLDVVERAFRRMHVPGSIGDLMTVRDIDTALMKARRFLEDALPYAPVRPSSECSGIAASWCPIHGDCTCPRQKNGDPVWRKNEEGVVEDEKCPLHGFASNHAETHRP